MKPFCLQVWPQARAVRVLVLFWRRDPGAREEKARLDREVGGLEPFLEGMPTVLVIIYMSYYKAGCQKNHVPNTCKVTPQGLFRK